MIPSHSKSTMRQREAVRARKSASAEVGNRLKLTGCSERLYHSTVIIENMGRHIDSNHPSRNLVAASPVKLCDPAIPQSAAPQQKTIMGMRCFTEYFTSR